MSFSRLKIKLARPVREVSVSNGPETLVSRNRMEALLQEKFQAGFESGQKSLGQELVNQRGHLLELQRGVLSSLEKTLPRLAGQCEEALIRLTVEATRRVMHQIPISAELVENTVKTAVAELKDSADYKVVLHPEDLELLKSVNSPSLLPEEGSRVRFGASTSVPRGGCLVESNFGSIRLTREIMLKNLEEALL